jgi:tRNA(Arg) A34 adenosine deaminase TadA
MRGCLGDGGEDKAVPDDAHYLRLAAQLAAESRARGDHPFGALLVGPEGEVLLGAGNTFSVDGGLGHAETNLAREAARRWGPEFLAGCTLVTTVEPCCMCAGAAYWAGIGTVVYGVSERRLGELTGDNPENLTLDLDCRQVFAAGRRPVAVRGPFPDLEAELLRDHAGFW